MMDSWNAEEFIDRNKQAARRLMERHVMTANDTQVGGDHYKEMKIQPWEALEAWLTPEQYEGYLLGTAIAYLARYNAEAPGKGGSLDAGKAHHTLTRLLEVMQQQPATQTL